MADDFVLTGDELREVAAFALASAEVLLPVFEARVPGDGRPRAAVEAARRFVAGERRTKLQRVTSLDAHRAAAEAPGEVARLAARACGDAASAAYLHPIAKAHQVGHLLRAAACEARVAELVEGHEDAGRRCSPTPPDGRRRCSTRCSRGTRAPCLDVNGSGR